MDGQWSYDWLSTTFMSAINKIGRVVVVVGNPWYKPLPFQRAWCVYEAYCALATDSTSLEVALMPATRRAFLQQVRVWQCQNPSVSVADLLEQRLGEVKTRKATASVHEDQDNILSLIEQQVGFEELDRLLLHRYRRLAVFLSVSARDEIVLDTSSRNSGS